MMNKGFAETSKPPCRVAGGEVKGMGIWVNYVVGRHGDLIITDSYVKRELSEHKHIILNVASKHHYDVIKPLLYDADRFIEIVKASLKEGLIERVEKGSAVIYNVKDLVDEVREDKDEVRDVEGFKLKLWIQRRGRRYLISKKEDIKEEVTVREAEGKEVMWSYYSEGIRAKKPRSNSPIVSDVMKAFEEAKKYTSNPIVLMNFPKIYTYIKYGGISPLVPLSDDIIAEARKLQAVLRRYGVNADIEDKVPLWRVVEFPVAIREIPIVRRADKVEYNSEMMPFAFTIDKTIFDKRVALTFDAYWNIIEVLDFPKTDSVKEMVETLESVVEYMMGDEAKDFTEYVREIVREIAKRKPLWRYRWKQKVNDMVRNVTYERDVEAILPYPEAEVPTEVVVRQVCEEPLIGHSFMRGEECYDVEKPVKYVVLRGELCESCKEKNHPQVKPTEKAYEELSEVFRKNMLQFAQSLNLLFSLKS